MNEVAVGSTNPVKSRAAEEAFELIGRPVDVVPVDVESGVSDQPTSDAEAIEGAMNRAERAIKQKNSEFGLGLEGSTHDTTYGMFLTGWAYLVEKDGSGYIGGGGRLELPESIAGRLRQGEELGPVMDEVTGRDEVKKGPGAIGIFTGGIITRQSAYRDAVIFAMARLIRPDLYIGDSEAD